MVGILKFLEKFEPCEKAVPVWAWLTLVLAVVLFKNFVFPHHTDSFLAVKINTEGKGIVNKCGKNNANKIIADAFSCM